VNQTQKQKAFTEAYEACHEPFVRYCSALAFGKFDVQDLVQDVLVSAFQNFENLEDQSKLLHYLIRAAKFRTISIWRKPSYKNELIDQHADRLRSQGVSAEQLLEIEDLYKALDQLPEAQRKALVMFEISGFSMKEIAEIQNSTEGAIKTKISRGRSKLKEIIEREESSSLRFVLETVKTIAL